LLFQDGAILAKPASGWHLCESGGHSFVMKQFRTLFLIVVILGASALLVFPHDSHPGINFAGINREIKTHLGLDLVGGVQVRLEADLPEDAVIADQDMRTTASIVEKRVNSLGTEEAVVQRARDRFLVVELPGYEDPEKAIAVIRETALLEFVDLSSLPVEIAQNMEGTSVETDYGRAGTTQTESGMPVYPTIMTGAMIRDVGVQPLAAGRYEVAFELNSEGAQIFREYTSQNVGRVLAIALDKEIISAPTVNSAIAEGRASITGNFTLESANQLAVQLRFGALPIPLKVVETRQVGPSLGEDSLNKSLVAGAIGFTIVILFMSLYYRLPGLVAVLAILSYALITFALFRFLPVTLTLPGIAGLMLSTGSALDANILIFERLKEELRAGKTLRQAMDMGWQRAWPSIRDSNISTIITCAILFYFGSAFGATIVKGFSLTLLLGVFVSLFTALVITRTFLNMVMRLVKTNDLTRLFGL
jgi:preprotein translocase subunit SecD